MAEKFAAIFTGLPPEVITILLGAIPLTELRGSIPWAIFVLDLSWQKAIIFSVIGNLIPVPFILLLLGPAERILSRWPLFKRFFEWLFARTRRRGKVVENFKTLGLMMFVAIPLPVTGAWTGSVAAYIFGIKSSHAMIALTAGVCIAGVIVTLACQGVLGFWDISQKFM